MEWILSRGGVDREKLGRLEGRKIILSIYYLRKDSIFNKRKKGKMKRKHFTPHYLKISEHSYFKVSTRGTNLLLATAFEP